MVFLEMDFVLWNVKLVAFLYTGPILVFCFELKFCGFFFLAVILGL